MACAFLALALRRDNPAFAALIALTGSVLIFFMIVPRFGAALEMIRLITDNLGSGAAYVTTVLKIIGIAYAAEFGAGICADAGETGLAQRVELAGKILILAAAAPVVLTLLRQVLTVL